MIVDTSALLAYFDSNEPDHRDVAEVIDGSDEPLVVSPYVDAELAVLRELSGGAWEIAGFGIPELGSAITVIGKYRDQHIGVADASNVVLADRHPTRTIATLDRRHFEVLRPIGGGRFAVVP